MKSTPFFGLAALLLSTHLAAGQTLQDARSEVYKTVDDANLNLHIFEPKGHAAGDKRPAIVFFFGGGWRSGSPSQFEKHCAYLASRGMVAITVDYRVASRHDVKAVKCVQDARSAIRWVRTNAARLGIDPGRIVAAGGSAGGHLAACTAIIREHEETGADTSVSAVPNALVLFNPALVLAPVEGVNLKALVDEQRMGVPPVDLSPYHHVRKGLPPALVLHGKADTTVPHVTAEMFVGAMKKAGNRCELVSYEGQAHGFFNFGRGSNEMYKETVRRMDQFLESLCYIKGKPAI